jgi:DNA-binding transcriptional MerR regulator
MPNKEIPGLMKIGEIAKAANTSVSTVKYYVSQGLISVALKTSANMAYYHPSSVQRILLIKRLQKEKFYPLSLIKKLLEQKDQMNMEIELMDAINKVPPSGVQSSISLSSAPNETGLTRKQINELIRSNIVEPVVIDRKKVLTESSIKIMQLVKRRIDGGIPFEQTLASFGIYGHELRKAVEGDIDAVIAQTLLKGEYSTFDMVQLIRLSDETLDEFIKYKRHQLNSYFGSRRVEELTLFLENINDFLFSCLIPAIGDLQGSSSFIQLCHLIYKRDYDAALELSLREKDLQFAWAFRTLVLLKKNCGEESLPRPISGNDNVFATTVEKINLLLRLGKRAGLSVVIPTCRQCKEFFVELNPQKTEDDCCKLFLYYIRIAFLYLAPSVLDCGKQAGTAINESLNFCITCIKDIDEAKVFSDNILKKLNLKGGQL